MKLERVPSPIANPLLQQYWENESWVKSFFPYEVTQSSFSKRSTWLNGQAYERNQLVQVIRSYMAPYTLSQKAEQHLFELERDALVVVGGQQAGVLTGPLFSVYKAITVILLAKEQSQLLQVPVVPVFWIAGEDHDIDEINHTYTMQEGRVVKQIFGGSSKIKKMASETAFDREQMKQYVESVFKDYGETQYTAQLLERVLAPIDTCDTFTQYFAALLQQLFTHEGLLFIDAAYEPLRKLESSYFQKIIRNNERIAFSVVEQENALVAQGFSAPLQAIKTNANLFYVKNGERFLLERKGDVYTNSLKGIRFTEDQLLKLAYEHPERLSNNVVTRPLMQEMIMPVLAFVGGPGELAYWATLKTAFEVVDLQMPIFVPRLSMTLIPRKVQYAMQQANISLPQVFNNEIPTLKADFIEQQKSEMLIATIARMEQQLKSQYEQFAIELQQRGLNLESTLERNENYHMQQFDYLKRKLHDQYELKHEVMLRQMNTVHAQLLPNDKPQERMYAVYQFMNDVGPAFLTRILEQVEAIEPKHIVVRL